MTAKSNPIFSIDGPFDPIIRGPFAYHRDAEPTYNFGIETGRVVAFRVHDGDDNRIATCYDEGNARFIVFMLNKATNPNDERTTMKQLTHEERCDAIVTAAEEIIELARVTRQQSHHTKDHAGLISGYLTNIEQLINPWENENEEGEES